jgi:hypothetical protein
MVPYYIPNKIKTLHRVTIVFEHTPEAENSHEDGTAKCQLALEKKGNQDHVILTLHQK